MSNNIDSLDHTEQARHHIRVVSGRDNLTGNYNLTDVNDDGRAAARNYVWDTGTLQWVAMASNNTASVQYDEMVLSYTGTNLTEVVYKLLGNVISTITLSYDLSGNLTHVVRA